MAALQKSRRSKQVVSKPDIPGATKPVQDGHPATTGPGSPATANRAHFLAYRFQPITLAYALTKLGITGPIPDEMYTDLEDAYKFASSKLKDPPELKYPYDFANYRIDRKIQFIYKKFCEIIPDGFEANIEYTPAFGGGKFLFVCYNQPNCFKKNTGDFGYMVYPEDLMVPIDYLLNMKEINHKLYRATISWLHYLSRELGIRLWNHNGIALYIQFLQSKMMEMVGTGDIEEYAKEISDMTNQISLFTSGYYKEMLKLINEIGPTRASVRKQLSKVKSTSKLEGEMIKLMFQGLDISHVDLSLAKFEYDSDRDLLDNEKVPPLDMHSYIGFIWTTDDDIFDGFNEFMSKCIPQIGFQYPTMHYPVASFLPDQVSKVPNIEWPVQFCQFMKDYQKLAIDYKKQHTTKKDEPINKQLRIRS
jgi:hypothetical protein